MAVDEYLLELCRGGCADAALRFYQWEPPAVSLGYSQAFDLLDLAACRDEGVDVVKRITGGGALLHWQELTYCLVLRRDSAAGAVRPRETANAVSRSLVLGLSRLGVEARARSRSRRPVERSDAAPAAEGAGSPEGRFTDLCFASGVENEIEVSGRKLAGCAHKLTREAFFSHGSVMTGPAHLRVARLLRQHAGPSATRLARSIAERSVSLSEVLQGAPAVDEMERELRSAFESVFALRFRTEGLSRDGARLVGERAAEKRAALAAALQAVRSTGGAL